MRLIAAAPAAALFKLRASVGPPCAAGGLPGAEAPRDVGDRLQPHPLCGLRRERRSRTGGAEEHELAVGREDRLVILARRIEPELQHAARAVEGGGPTP